MRAARFAFLAVAAALLATRVAASPLGTAAPLGPIPLDDADRGEIVSTDTDLRPAPAGNPLWAIPLSALGETRERPLFSPSRRPPAAVADVRHRPPERLPPRPTAPDHPHLQLLGTIVGDSQSFALFLDTSSKTTVRLRTGSIYHGWLLRTVRERTVVLEKNHLNQMLALPLPAQAQAHEQPVAATRPPARPARASFRHSPPVVDAADGSGVYR